MSKVEERLKSMGIELPEPAAPVAAYAPFVEVDGLVFVSGQLPIRDGELVSKGTVGAGVNLEQARAGARQCAINAIAVLKVAAAGDLDRVERVVKLEGFVASASGFNDQHLVMNAASELVAEVFGDVGKHARAAVGVASLPLGASVEVALIARITG